MTKHCKNCNKLNENILLKYCRTCYPTYWKKLVKTQINPISDKKKERLKETWWEKEVFRHKLITNQINWKLKCNVCQKYFAIEDAWPWCLPHILNKKDYPHLRLFINNLWIACSIECHQEFDVKINKIKKEIGNKQLEEMIASWKDISNLINNYK